MFISVFICVHVHMHVYTSVMLFIYHLFFISKRTKNLPAALYSKKKKKMGE